MLAAALPVSGAQAASGPVPPCPGTATAIHPGYGAPGGPPVVMTWRDLTFEEAGTCLGALRGRQELTVALAGRFVGPTGIEEIAARIGAVSSTDGLLYWSATDGRWRPLISRAFALARATPDAPRADFTADEVMSGESLTFGQDDTRSSGLNLYSLAARAAGPDRLVIETVNLTPIRYLFVTLFEPRDLVAVHVIDRLGPAEWGYYGLSAVRGGAPEGHEASFVNRATAFYRFLTE